ncbi:flavin-containing monooxygenase [Emydomyces testavorans]|uniref:Flavin-containing monooxygenase 1 n=1 Tax=Emydomyces testavorans TaxID=2070801 RepID=A0AAF0DDX7_9EURO|nr:flavin-containing monooxygenase [Emydomyces testavorans]
MALKVAIVGAGLSGLVSLKQCLEEGFDATIFETRPAIGGQWCYEEPDPVTGETTSSIYEGVLLNSCRDTSSFSDFPMDPARYPDYFSHRGMLRYLEEYADHFGLKKHIRFNTTVISCSQGKDGKWTVKTGRKEGRPVEDIYDAVFACSGSLAKPAIPKFEGLETFKGKVFHSRVYRRPSGLEGKRIAIIGFGNSAADLSSELSWQAKELHLITRRGGWIVPRFVLGKPAEAYDSRVAETILPAKFSQWCQTKLCNHVMGTLPEVIQPEHGLMEANVTMRSDLLENIKTGRITPHRAGVQKVTKTSLILTNGTSIDVDIIICCTGYRMNVPYVPEHSYRTKHNNEILNTSNSMDLYKLVASPCFPNLFFIGFVELAGPLIPVSEAQARWATSVLSNRIKLPSVTEMHDSIAAYQTYLASTMVNSDRHTVTVRYLPYCDTLLNDLGATPTFAQLFCKMLTSNPLTAAKILKAVYLGINSSAQYRLFGHGSKPELATAMLLRLADGAGALSEEERDILETSKLVTK